MCEAKKIYKKSLAFSIFQFNTLSFFTTTSISYINRLYTISYFIHSHLVHTAVINNCVQRHIICLLVVAFILTVITQVKHLSLFFFQHKFHDELASSTYRPIDISTSIVSVGISTKLSSQSLSSSDEISQNILILILMEEDK